MHPWCYGDPYEVDLKLNGSLRLKPTSFQSAYDFICIVEVFDRITILYVNVPQFLTS